MAVMAAKHLYFSVTIAPASIHPAELFLSVREFAKRILTPGDNFFLLAYF